MSLKGFLIELLELNTEYNIYKSAGLSDSAAFDCALSDCEKTVVLLVSIWMPSMQKLKSESGAWKKQTQKLMSVAVNCTRNTPGWWNGRSKTRRRIRSDAGAEIRPFHTARKLLPLRAGDFCILPRISAACT